MDIPKHWLKVPLHDLVIVQKGVKPKKLRNTKFENSLPYLDVEGVEKGIVKWYADGLSAIISNEEDIFVLRTGGRNGLVLKGKNGAVGSTFFCLTPIMINKKFLFYFLKSTEFSHSGSRDLYNSFWDIHVPLPPLEEQDRIVESLETRLNEYQKDFDSAKSEMNKIVDYKKGIYEHAVTGKMSEDWRIKQTGGLEIDQWGNVQLINLVEKLQYGSSKKAISNGLVPVLRMGNIQNGKVDWSDLKYSSDENEIEKLKLNKGDVLFNRTNSPELVGKTAIYEGEREAIFAGYIIRIVCKKQLNPYYLNIFLNSSLAKLYFDKVKVGSANQANISADKISKILIPLPSIEEQAKIVSLVENQLFNADQILNQNGETINTLENLIKSVINMAFQGHLSKPKTEHEDQSILLEKIRNEKSKIEYELIAKRKTKLKTQNKMKAEDLLKKTIRDILNNSAMKALTVEELWEETLYSKTNDVEAFYEELYELKDKEIEVSWLDSNKLISIIKLKENAN